MAAYVLAEVDVTDPVRYESYKNLAQEAIAKHGGRYLVRGGSAHVLEGGRVPKRLVLLEFENVASAKRFYESAEYAEAIKAREGAAHMSMIVVEGL